MFPLVQAAFLSPLGEVCVAAHAQAVCGVWFADAHRVPGWMLVSPAAKAQAPEALNPATKLIQEATRQIHTYLAGERKTFDLPLDVSWATPFQQAVWGQLLNMAWGQTATYADVARAIGKPQAVRAVGTAIGRNPLSVLVPCHRVVGAQGQLTGYSGGLHRKQALLALESQR
jgi:methylated-DNA-[protein]-cysteine S-methyltransferase